MLIILSTLHEFSQQAMTGSTVCVFCVCLVSSNSETPWTVAYQAPLSIVFPGKNTGVGCHFLLQGIFLTQGLNLHLLHCRKILYN